MRFTLLSKLSPNVNARHHNPNLVSRIGGSSQEQPDSVGSAAAEAPRRHGTCDSVGDLTAAFPELL